MIAPQKKPLQPWQPKCWVGQNVGHKPLDPAMHFIVNMSYQAIMRAMVSSRIAMKENKQ